MIDQDTLEQMVERIIAVATPSRVILIGSQGRGESDEGSDLDLMVVKPSIEDRGEELVRLAQALSGIGMGVDLLLYTEAEYERRSQVPGTLLYWAEKEGKVLYESAH